MQILYVELMLHKDKKEPSNYSENVLLIQTSECFLLPRKDPFEDFVATKLALIVCSHNISNVRNMRLFITAQLQLILQFVSFCDKCFHFSTEGFSSHIPQIRVFGGFSAPR